MPDVTVASGDILGESPVWSETEQALYWVDLRRPALHRLQVRTGRVDTWTMPDLCAAVVLARNGVVVALRTGLFRFDPSMERLRPLVSPEPPDSGNRLNETKVDRRGRLWTSSMRDFGAACTGALYRVDRALASTRVLAPITIPNAVAWSPDDATMYFADTAEGRLRAYAFDAESGLLGDERTLVEAGALPGKPDGATVDRDGGIWNARYGAGCVARILPDGRVDRVIALPATQVTSCCLGGADLTTLYVTSARQRLSEAELAAQPLAGSLFAARVDVPGLPEPRFDV